MANLAGNWTLAKSENFEAYLEALGLPEDKRKAAAGATPTIEIQQSGGDFSVTMMGRTHSFKVDTEFEHDLPNGQKAKGSAKWDGSKLVVTAKTTAGKTHTTTRELQGDQLVQTFDMDGVSCKRYFNRA